MEIGKCGLLRAMNWNTLPHEARDKGCSVPNWSQISKSSSQPCRKRPSLCSNGPIQTSLYNLFPFTIFFVRALRSIVFPIWSHPYQVQLQITEFGDKANLKTEESAETQNQMSWDWEQKQESKENPRATASITWLWGEASTPTTSMLPHCFTRESLQS